MRLLLLLFLSLVCSGPLFAQPQTLELVRLDGTRLIAYLDRPTSSSNYPLVVICQGSEALSVAPKYREWVDHLSQFGVATLRVEKPGLVATSEGASEEYLRLNCLSRRSLDVLECLAHLERTEPGWNGNLALLGGSEGAEVAAQVAALQSPRRLRGLVVVVAATTRVFREELLRSIPEAPPEFLQQLDEVHRNPTWTLELGSDGKTARNTYKWWAEALEVEVCRNLDKLQCPLYIVHGELDPFTPPEVEALLRHRLAGKEFTYVRVPGCDHNIASFPQGKAALGESFDWIVRQLSRPTP